MKNSEHYGEVISYPYAARLSLAENGSSQLYIRLALDEQTSRDNWIPVKEIVSQALEPNQRYSSYRHQAITESGDFYEFSDGDAVWQAVAVAVTALAHHPQENGKKPVAEEKIIHLKPEVETESAAV